MVGPPPPYYYQTGIMVGPPPPYHYQTGIMAMGVQTLDHDIKQTALGISYTPQFSKKITPTSTGVLV
jgi:hypothetical protein